MTGNNGNKSKWNVLDVIEGRISPTHFRPESLKQKMIDEGYLKEECAICGFHDRRINDYVMPLILDFADNNPQHYGLGNIRFLCYNCFFITRGNIFNKKDITQIETYTPKNGTSEAINFQLTPYQLEQMERLGVYQPPKPKPEDGSEFISRI